MRSRQLALPKAAQLRQKIMIAEQQSLRQQRNLDSLQQELADVEARRDAEQELRDQDVQ